MSYNATADPLNSLANLPMASQKTADELLGPFFVGWIGHLILFGLEQSQFWNYVTTDLYASDPLRVKLILWAVIGLDATAVAFDAEELFHYGTDQHRDHDSLFVARPVDSAPPLLTGLIALLVQTFLIRRAAQLFKHNLLRWWAFVGSVSFVAILSFLASCGSFAIGEMWGYGEEWKALPFTYNNLASTWLMTSLAVDCALCLTLVLLLRKRFDVGDRSSPVRRLISTTIQSAAVPALFGLAGAVLSCFPQSSDQTANMPFVFITPLPSLYALALVTTLGGRTARAPVVVTGTVLNAESDFLSPLGPPSGADASFQRLGIQEEGGMMSLARTRSSRAALDDLDLDLDDKDDDLLAAGEGTRPQVMLTSVLSSSQGHVVRPTLARQLSARTVHFDEPDPVSASEREAGRP